LSAVEAAIFLFTLAVLLNELKRLTSQSYPLHLLSIRRHSMPLSRRGEVGLIPSHGVEIHASLTSQIVSAAFGQRHPIKVLASHTESWLIVLYTFFGIGLYHWCQTDFQRLQLYGALLCTSLGLSQLALMIGGWWLPIVPASIALMKAPLVIRLHNIHRLKTLSEVDDLTRLANRRSFQKHLASKWQWAVRSRTPISLVLCDVDYFKLYNDTYVQGQTAGPKSPSHAQTWAVD
jgi:hypothetical protein